MFAKMLTIGLLIIVLVACETEDVPATPTPPPVLERTPTAVAVVPTASVTPTATLTEITPSITPSLTFTITLTATDNPPSDTPIPPPTDTLQPFPTATAQPTVTELPPFPSATPNAGQGGGIVILSTAVVTPGAPPTLNFPTASLIPPTVIATTDDKDVANASIPNNNSAVANNAPPVSNTINPIPLPPVVDGSTLPTIPNNIDLDSGQVQQQGIQEINVPQGWVAWWREGTVDCTIYLSLPTDGQCPTLQDPDTIYKRPEFTVVSQIQYPNRVRDGQAARFFCVFGVCQGGYMQRVQTTPGANYVFSAYGFSWCSQGDTINVSQLATRDDFLNCEIAVGIDPTGGIDPLSPNIIWSTANIYDSFSLLATPPVTATTNVMTLYIRGRSLWGLKHNDFHFDDLNFAQQ